MSAFTTALAIANRLRKEHPELVTAVAELVTKVLDGAPPADLARKAIAAGEKRATLEAFKQSYRRK